MSNEEGRPNEGDRSERGSRNVDQRVDGDGNTTVGVSGDGGVTVNPKSEDEGRPATDIGNIFIGVLRAIFGWIYRRTIGKYVDIVAVPLGILTFIGLFVGGIAMAILTFGEILDRGAPIPLYTDYIVPAATFLQDNVVPTVAWFVLSVPNRVLLAGGVIMIASLFYWFTKQITHCNDCGREFMNRLVTLEYPRDAYVDGEGRTITPRETKFQCPHCEEGQQGVVVSQND